MIPRTHLVLFHGLPKSCLHNHVSVLFPRLELRVADRNREHLPRPYTPLAPRRSPSSW